MATQKPFAWFLIVFGVWAFMGCMIFVETLAGYTVRDTALVVLGALATLVAAVVLIYWGVKQLREPKPTRILPRVGNARKPPAQPNA